MAGNTQLSDAAANAACDAVRALANGGSIKFYTGTQPANANTAVSSQVLLATLTLPNPAFGSASGGSASLLGVPISANAVASGTATWFRVLKSDGTTVVFDGNVGTSGCNINLNSNVISSGALVSISSLSYSITEAGT
jgi:hypothetical protein